MGYRSGIVAAIALALSSLALAGMISTDAYSHAAHAEARGYDALAKELQNSGVTLSAVQPETVAQ